MTDYAAFTLSTVLKMNQMSNVSGSSIAQHVFCEPDHRSTGSLSINPEWWIQQTRSGQNYHVINNQKSSLEQKIDIIKLAFAMSEDDIAQSVGVTRKTLFNWKKQDYSPNKVQVQNIFDLYLLAKNWIDAGFSTATFDLETPVLASQSIKDMLRESKLDSEKILFAGNRLAHQSLGEVVLF